MKLSKNFISLHPPPTFRYKNGGLECWVNVNLNFTVEPILLLDLKILTRKQPSASVNPANHWGSKIGIKETIGLGKGTISGRLLLMCLTILNSLRRPSGSQQRADAPALIPTILRKPPVVKCSLRFISSITRLNKRKFCAGGRFLASAPPLFLNKIKKKTKRRIPTEGRRYFIFQKKIKRDKRAFVS